MLPSSAKQVEEAEMPTPHPGDSNRIEAETCLLSVGFVLLTPKWELLSAFDWPVVAEYRGSPGEEVGKGCGRPCGGLPDS